VSPTRRARGGPGGEIRGRKRLGGCLRRRPDRRPAPAGADLRGCAMAVAGLGGGVGRRGHCAQGPPGGLQARLPLAVRWKAKHGWPWRCWPAPARCSRGAFAYRDPRSGERVTVEQAVRVPRSADWTPRRGPAELLCWGVLGSGLLRHAVFVGWQLTWTSYRTSGRGDAVGGSFSYVVSPGSNGPEIKFPTPRCREAVSVRV
jgi:hypothetical protein